MPVLSARLAYLFAALPPLFWAGNFLVARAMRDVMPPFQMSFWRWFTAFLILLPFGLPALREHGPQLRRESPFLAVLGIFGVTAFNCFVYVALHYTTVINAALINSLMPIVTFLLALALLRDRPTAVQMLGVALALAGAAVVIARGEPAHIANLVFNRGELLVLLGLTCWATYTVLIKWRPTKLPPLAFLPATFGLGALFHLPLVAWEWRSVGGFTVTPNVVGSILFFAVFPSVLAYIFWNKAVAMLGPARTSTFMYLMPIFSAVLGVWLLDEPFQAYHLVGIVLVFSGIAFVTHARIRG